jgi:peptidoglycan/xylan/chitin deacetylase (PgdA/CDA1 family)
MISKVKCIDPWRVFIFLIIAGGLLLQVSCIEFMPGAKENNPGPPEEKTQEPPHYKSEDYIVYKLSGGETPATLAVRFLGDVNKAWVIEDENKGSSLEKGQWVVIPLQEKNKGGLQSDGYQVVPILTYQDFAEKCEAPHCTPRETFIHQMNYLKENGYRVISLKDLLGFLEYKHGIPEKSVVITVDDGYRSFYKIAYPILNEYGFKATLFITTDLMRKSKNRVTWNQLKKMKADGFEVGSGCLSRTDLSKKRKKEREKAYFKRIENELVRSKKIIDRKLGQKTIYLAFPFGGYNQRILQMSEHAGYKIGLSVKKGSNPFFADPLSLKRNRVTHREIEHFIANLETFKKFSLE